MHLQNNLNADISLEQLSIYLSLFADDAAIVSETKEGLQESLNNVQTYCSRWNLTVNVQKTKIVVFRKGGVLSNDYTWTYDGQEIEIVPCFNYLGITLSCGGSLIHTTNALSGKALRVMSSLLNLTKGMEVPINMMLNLFDSYFIIF